MTIYPQTATCTWTPNSLPTIFPLPFLTPHFPHLLLSPCSPPPPAHSSPLILSSLPSHTYIPQMPKEIMSDTFVLPSSLQQEVGQSTVQMTLILECLVDTITKKSVLIEVQFSTTDISHISGTIYLRSDATATFLFVCFVVHFSAATNQGWRFFHWEAGR